MTSCRQHIADRKDPLTAFRSRRLIAHSGFTLLELMVVIFIVSLMLAVSIPSFTDIGEGRTMTEAKRLASVIRYLNDTAVSAKEGSYMKVVFNGRLLTYKTSGEEKNERFETISGMELQSGGIVSEGEVVVFFDPAGAGESFRIYLKDEKTEVEVAFNSASGRVRIS